MPSMLDVEVGTATTMLKLFLEAPYFLRTYHRQCVPSSNSMATAEGGAAPDGRISCDDGLLVFVVDFGLE